MSCPLLSSSVAKPPSKTKTSELKSISTHHHPLRPYESDRQFRPGSLMPCPAPTPSRRMRRILSIAVISAFLGPIAARGQAVEPRPIDWNALAGEGQKILSDYLRVNTTNSPGNETKAAVFLKAILDREGIPAQILDSVELGPGRANLYARL